MPDISMCTSHRCELKLKCYRYTATPSDFRQSYMNFSPDASPELEGCSFFIDNKNKDGKNKRKD